MVVDNVVGVLLRCYTVALLADAGANANDADSADVEADADAAKVIYVIDVTDASDGWVLVLMLHLRDP